MPHFKFSPKAPKVVKLALGAIHWFLNYSSSCLKEPKQTSYRSCDIKHSRKMEIKKEQQYKL